MDAGEPVNGGFGLNESVARKRDESVNAVDRFQLELSTGKQVEPTVMVQCRDGLSTNEIIWQF